MDDRIGKIQSLRQQIYDYTGVKINIEQANNRNFIEIDGKNILNSSIPAIGIIPLLVGITIGMELSKR